MKNIELTEYEFALVNMALRSQAVAEFTNATNGGSQASESLKRGKAYSELADKLNIGN